MKKVLKAITILLIPLLLISIAFLIIYPNYSDIVIYANSFDTKQIAHNSALKALTSLSPRTFTEDLSDEQYGAVLSVEDITPEALAAFNNSGDVYRSVQSSNTELSVDSANIKGKVYDGEDANTMMTGLWHFPLSVGPGDKGNFVVIAHRFAKVPPETDTFFNLDKVRIGDKIEITQDGGIKYTYTVTERKVVDKDDRTVLQPVGDHRATLITCSPLWTSRQRLVIVGVLDKVYQKI